MRILGSPPRQPRPRRSLGRVPPLALGRPSELVRDSRLSSVTRVGRLSAKVTALSASVPTCC